MFSIDMCNPLCYLVVVLAFFVLTVILLILIACLCIHLCDRMESRSSSADVEALLEESCESQDQQGPLSAMRVLSGASLLSALAPNSVRRTDDIVIDVSNW